MTAKGFILVLTIAIGVPQAALAQAGARAEGRGQSQVGAAPGAQVQTQAQVQAEAQTPQARIDAALAAAARTDIPVALLSNKVAEGRAKRVPPDRIAAAVEARLTVLLRAAAALRSAQIGAASTADLSVTADALEAGASESAVIRIARSAPPERRVVAVAVMTDLVRLGNSLDAAFARVDAALGANAALANLQAEVAASAALANLQAEVTSQLQIQGLEPTLDPTLDPLLDPLGGITLP
jgi:hypothetical protein